MNAQNEKQDVQNLKLVSNEDGWKCVEVNGKSSVIPNSWSVRVIGKEIRFTLGHTPPKEGNNYSGETCWVTISNLDSSGRVSKYSAKISSNKTRTLPKGSLVGSFKMTIGRFGILEIPAITNEAIVGAAPEDAPNHNLNYLRHALVKPFKDGATINGQGVQLLNTKTINSLSFVAPPHPEQQRIASVLTSQESRIEDLRTWAQTERDRLTWLTDELLSGRVRVVERIGAREVVVEQNANGHVVEGLGAYDLVDHTSNAPWASTTVREIGKSTSGATPPTSDKQYWGGDLIWVTPKDMDDLDGPYIKTSEKKLTQAGYDFMERKKVSAGSVIFSTRGSIGKVAAAKKEMRISQSCESFSFDDSSPEFMVYLFRWKMAEIKEKGAGTTFMSITKKDIEDIEVSIPEKHEQQRIAAVLSAQERQIADIEQLIELEQQRLSWLTDELLSGRVRVVENT